MKGGVGCALYTHCDGALTRTSEHHGDVADVGVRVSKWPGQGGTNAEGRMKGGVGT
jgi:hypothetical protein